MIKRAIDLVRRYRLWFQALISAAVTFAINPWVGIGYYGVIALIWLACTIANWVEARKEA